MQFLTVVLYVALFVDIRRRVVECIRLRGRSTKNLRRMNRVARFMVLYPIVYICLTLPLAAGRMADTSGHTPSVTYFCVAGSLMTLSGLCDTVLYALARKNSVLDPEGARVTSNDSNELPSGGSALDGSTLDDDPVSADRVPSHLSDVTDLDVPNTDVERVA